MRRRVMGSPTGESKLVDAWQLRVGERVFRFIRPDAAADLLEELGERPLPTTVEVLKTRKAVLRAGRWSVTFAPLTQQAFNDMERG